MRLLLTELIVPQPRILEFLENDKYTDLPLCPVCDSSNTRLLSRALGQKHGGIEVSLCKNCEHVYLSRRPRDYWYNELYSVKLGEKSDPQNSFQQRIRQSLRLLPVLKNISNARFLKAYGRVPIINAMFQGIVTNGMVGALRPRSDVRKVLEIGCGLGNNLKVYKNLGLETWGVEASPSRAAYCRSQGHRVSGIPIDNLGEMGNSGPFDMVTSSHVIEHVLDLNQHLHQIKSLLRPEGYLYLEMPNYNSEHLFHRTHSPVHVHVFTLKSITSLLHRHGFSIIRIFQDYDTHIIAIYSREFQPKLFCSETVNTDLLYRGLNKLDTSVEELVTIEYGNHVTRLTTNSTATERQKNKYIYEHLYPFASGAPVLVSATMKVQNSENHDLLEIEHSTVSPPLY
jgi:2-polyprenyl-3-methyl-5-hydroxy-6-metoxy-1,4-benzoquinol methylase